MKLKKKIKRLLVIFVLILLAIGGYLTYKELTSQKEPKEAKIINEIEDYGYKLKENKPERYKKLFKELKEILAETEVNEEKYVSKISEMFIYDFYSLDDKTAKTDIGGVDFIYNEILENVLQNAQSTYYKYVENNIYNNRNQKLPIVDTITIDSVEQKDFEYNGKTDNTAYYVKSSWTYLDNQFPTYQKEAELIFIHDGKKLCLVELQW